jgi:hypothetical protein
VHGECHDEREPQVREKTSITLSTQVDMLKCARMSQRTTRFVPAFFFITFVPTRLDRTPTRTHGRRFLLTKISEIKQA